MPPIFHIRPSCSTIASQVAVFFAGKPSKSLGVGYILPLNPPPSIANQEFR
jgi:hypothetical protein